MQIPAMDSTGPKRDRRLESRHAVGGLACNFASFTPSTEYGLCREKACLSRPAQAAEGTDPLVQVKNGAPKSLHDAARPDRSPREWQ